MPALSSGSWKTLRLSLVPTSLRLRGRVAVGVRHTTRISNKACTPFRRSLKSLISAGRELDVQRLPTPARSSDSSEGRRARAPLAQFRYVRAGARLRSQPRISPSGSRSLNDRGGETSSELASSKDDSRTNRCTAISTSVVWCALTRSFKNRTWAFKVAGR